jgi:hypothetical protein
MINSTLRKLTESYLDAVSVSGFGELEVNCYLSEIHATARAIGKGEVGLLKKEFGAINGPESGEAMTEATLKNAFAMSSYLISQPEFGELNTGAERVEFMRANGITNRERFLNWRKEHTEDGRDAVAKAAEKKAEAKVADAEAKAAIEAFEGLSDVEKVARLLVELTGSVDEAISLGCLAVESLEKVEVETEVAA